MPLYLSRPDDETIKAYLATCTSSPFTYDEVGQSSGEPPSGWFINHGETRLGGPERWPDAVAALRGWRMFERDWLSLKFPDTSVEVGAVVAVLAPVWGLWALNPCRIVYVEPGETRWSFGYGTVGDHMMSGEERFTVELRDDGVWYEVLSFSRPSAFLARVGLPIVRRLQIKFAPESGAAMKAALEVG